MKIKSFYGGYEVIYDKYDKYIDEDYYYIISSTIKKIYGIKPKKAIYIDNPENAKEYSKISGVIQKLLDMGIKRQDTIVGIGGGAIQDVTGFTASVILRGVKWGFMPTTLMSQADSCIGSKTSINFMMAKNQVGTFYPPEFIVSDVRFLDSLPKIEISSGMGEIVKCHILDGKTKLVSDDRQELIKYALNVKKKYIEEDEFDRSIRHSLNYGHTFGHALEGASNHSIVHGLAVVLGVDISNYIAYRIGKIDEKNYDRIKNFTNQYKPRLPDVLLEDVMKYLRLDKKNISDDYLNLIIVNSSMESEEIQIPYDSVEKYFSDYRELYG